MTKTLSEINVHIFGDGKGESEVIIFPKGEIGIIDFGSSVFLNWIEKYIMENKIDEIEFLLWTHPHYDHSSQLSVFLDFLDQKQIIINNFFAFNYQHIMDIAVITNYEDKISAGFSTPYSYKTFNRPAVLKIICDKIIKLKKSIIKNFQYIDMGAALYDAEKFNNVSIRCLSPAPKSSEKYHQFITSFNSEENNITIEHKNHNLISAAIQINFNNNILIFGADTENEVWQEVSAQNRYTFFDKEIKFLKVPHHGSRTAFNKDIWKKWGKDYQAVVTPLSLNKLPDENVLMDIVQITNKIAVLKENKEKTKSPLDIFADAKTDITDSKEETHHFLFNINQNGDCKTCWINQNTALESYL